MSDVSEALSGLSHVISTVVYKQSELVHDWKSSVAVNLYVLKCQQEVEEGWAEGGKEVAWYLAALPSESWYSISSENHAHQQTEGLRKV